MRFNVGEKALYPAHGVASIEKVESKDLGGRHMDFYVLKIVSSGATLMVPVDGSDKVGLRSLLSQEEISNVYEILQSEAKNSQKAWNRRIKEFNEKLRSGSIYDVAEVTRDLSALQATKDLSYGEKKIFEKCMGLLVDEIGASQEGASQEDIQSEISSCLHKS